MLLNNFKPKLKPNFGMKQNCWKTTSEKTSRWLWQNGVMNFASKLNATSTNNMLQRWPNVKAASRPSTTSPSQKPSMTSLGPSKPRFKLNSITERTANTTPIGWPGNPKFKTVSHGIATNVKLSCEMNLNPNSLSPRKTGLSGWTLNSNLEKQLHEKPSCRSWTPNFATNGCPTIPISIFSRRKPRLSSKSKWRNALTISKPARKPKWRHNSSDNWTSEKKSCATKRSLMFASGKRKFVLKSRPNSGLSELKFATA